MKQTFLIVALFISSFVQQVFAQLVPTLREDSTKSTLSPLLSSYFAIKDALVSSNPAVAATSAAAFVKAVDTVTVKEENRKTLLSDAGAISQTKDLKVQRVRFATLSVNMLALAKAVKLSTEPLYLQYCPMKQASWLSNSRQIRNPYYGNMMLTCGSVKETL